MELLAGRKHAPAQLGHVLVMGLGSSGRAAAEYCLGLLGGRVSRLSIAAGEERESSQAFAEEACRRGAHAAFGDNGVVTLAEMAAADAADATVAPNAAAPATPLPVGATFMSPPSAENGGPAFDLCIASPGISQFNYLYQSAERLSAEVISEVEFAWRESASDSKWVAVTGTNGKTTTTSLIAHLLKGAGLAASAVGNIGPTCIGAVSKGDTRVYVAELSSYQLVSTRMFAPNVAVLLNITPDHLKWHRSFEAYAQAKFKLLENLGDVPGAVAVLDATNDVVRARVRELHAAKKAGRDPFEYVPLGTAEGICGDMRARCGSENAAFLSGDGMVTAALRGVEHRLLPASDLLIKGEHNVGNALAAGVAALAMGAADEDVSRGLASFAPLEHRIEPCGSVDGVACYNDSKATNIDATCKALVSFPGDRLFVMLGGDDKGTDLSPLVAATHAHAVGVVCYGEAEDRFHQAFSDAADDAPSGFVLLHAKHMADAFDAVLGAAREGDVVVLSPACASFDEFTSFEERGRVFKALVASRARDGR